LQFNFTAFSMALLNYNGVICTEDELLCTAGNRALRYGEGLIETMLWQHKKIRLYERHMQRLQQSLPLLGFPQAHPAELQEEITRMILANQEPERGMIRMQFFREQEKESLQYMIEFIPIDPATGAWSDKGLTLGISDKIVKSADSITHLKTTSRLPYIIAATEAADKGWDDALLRNAAGRIAESTISNLFVVKDGVVYTPPLEDGCIAGVMRSHLLAPGSLPGVTLQERAIEEQDLDTADELFLANAIRGIQPVAWHGSKTYSSTLTREIFNLVSKL
jgi:branched-subunit amino acid aminotransferase/4-amino-4-deoxychorismate lyase